MERTAPLEALIEEAQAYLRGCQAGLDTLSTERNHETRQLIFSENGVPEVIPEVHVADPANAQPLFRPLFRVHLPAHRH